MFNLGRLALALGVVVSLNGAVVGQSQAAPAKAEPYGAAAKVAGKTGALKAKAFPPAPKLVKAKPSKKAKKSIVGGSVVTIQTVPWQAYVFTAKADCGGSILSATQIITAAHCVDKISQASMGQEPENGGIGVIVGLSDIVKTPISANDKPQYRVASALKVHPAWTGLKATTTGDLAIVTLAQPLSLDGATARAVVLPAPGSPAPDSQTGAAAYVSGYGVMNSGSQQVLDGQLRLSTLNVTDPDFCDVDENAVTVCGLSPTSTSCLGDSGGPLVLQGAPAGASPIQIGIVSNGPVGCDPNTKDLYTNLSAPENRQLIDGVPVPPAAPRRSFGNPSMTVPEMKEGQTVSCSPGTFTGAAAVDTKIIQDDGTVLASAAGPVSFVLTAGQVGKTVKCRSYAASPGGIAVSRWALDNRTVIAKPNRHEDAKGKCTRDPYGTEMELAVAKSRRTLRRGRTMTVYFAIRNTDPAATTVSVTGPGFKRGKKYAGYKRKTFDIATSKYSDGVIYGTFQVRAPSWAKIGKRYGFSFSAYSWDVLDRTTVGEICESDYRSAGSVKIVR